ncbi:MAG: alkaline phosphatase [Spirulina sp. SIO3F2]|nr:alkaline phosphatase [Spirulina sp. SIO3F2]
MSIYTRKFTFLTPFTLLGVVAFSKTAQSQSLNVLSTYQSGGFDEGAAEIAAYDADSQQLFITNAEKNTIDRLDISDPAAPVAKEAIDLSPYGGVNSVATSSTGLVAVAVEAPTKQELGVVVFFDVDGVFLTQVPVGALPDMVTFTPDGTKALVANEGEPNDDYTVDPEGSISIIDVTGNARQLSADDVQTVTFAAFSKERLLANGVRIFGPGATAAQDLEPEYIAVAADSQTAFVTLQENNAVAVVDIANATVTSIVSLGQKNHSIRENAIDASNKDGEINITTHPVSGLYLPDAIATLTAQGNTYFLTANEGDSRDYDGFSEEERVADLTLDSTAFPNAAELQAESALGQLKITTTLGDTDGDGDYEALYSYGARSFSVWSADGSLVWDSGSQFERTLAEALPENFNSTNDENDSLDNRSDDKGPEPEGITVGRIGARTYAFIGLERVGGIMVYDVTRPTSPRYVTYTNNRDFAGDAEAGTAGDLAPEGLLFIPAAQSPNDEPLLVVTNEVSGTTTIYGLDF